MTAPSTFRVLEADYCTTIIDAARLHGWLVMHQRPARTSSGWRTAIQGDAGWPDLLMVRDGVCLAVELKRRGNKATVDQLRWIDALDCVPGIEAFVLVVPEQMQELLARLPRPRGDAA